MEAAPIVHSVLLVAIVWLKLAISIKYIDYFNCEIISILKELEKKDTLSLKIFLGDLPVYVYLDLNYIYKLVHF